MLTKPIISNITCIGRVYDPDERVLEIDIFNLAQYIKCNDKPQRGTIPVRNDAITYLKYVDRFKCPKLNSGDKYVYNKMNMYENPWYIPDTNTPIDNAECVKDFNRKEPVTQNFLYEKNGSIKYVYDKSYFIIIIIKGVKYKKKNKKGSLKDFKNSITIEIPYNNASSIANCKVCTNGKIQMVGCSSLEYCHQIFAVLHRKFNEINERNINYIMQSPEYNPVINDDTIINGHVLRHLNLKTRLCLLSDISNTDISSGYCQGNTNIVRNHIIELKRKLYIQRELIFKGKIDVKYVRSEMMVAHMSMISNKILNLNLIDMHIYISELNRADITSTLSNAKKKRLHLYYTDENGCNIVYFIYQSGNITITSLKSSEQLEIAYQFIDNFIENNIEHFRMINIIDICQSLLSQELPEQKSDAWLEDRKKLVTASEVFKVIMDNPTYSSYETYIYDKANFIATGERSFKGNIYTKHGELFEPCAQAILAFQINSSQRYPYSVKLYEVGLYKSQTHDYIGASPDGIMLKYKKDTQPLWGNVVDGCLVEIKCPMNYKPIKHDVHEEKPHYYWQMQQQMFVTELMYCVFMQCDFKYFKDRTEYENDHHRPYKGGIDTINMKYYYHPNKIPTSVDVYWYLNAYDIQDVEYNPLYETHLEKIKCARDEFVAHAKILADDDYIAPLNI